jgi:hypothetical protein
VLLVKRQKSYDQTDCLYSINWFWNACEYSDPANESPGRKSGRATRNSETTLPENRVQRESSQEIFSKQETQPAHCAEVSSSRKRNKKGIGKEESKDSFGRLKERNPTVEQIRSVWEAAVFDTFQGAPSLTWSNREAEALRAYCKRWQHNHAEPFLEFMDWCVRHWEYIMKSSFNGMKSPPKLPAPLFFVNSKIRDRFEVEFGVRQHTNEMLSMTTREKMVRALVQQGYPSDVAAREVEDKLQFGKQFEKLNKERKWMQRAREFAKVEGKRAQELVRRLTSKSPEGEQAREKARRALQRRVPLGEPVKPVMVRVLQEIDWSAVPNSFGPYEAVQPVASSPSVE